jgi:hypothetical protein
VEATTAMLNHLAQLPAAEARARQHVLARLALRHVELLNILLDDPSGGDKNHAVYTYLTGEMNQSCRLSCCLQLDLPKDGIGRHALGHPMDRMQSVPGNGAALGDCGTCLLCSGYCSLRFFSSYMGP